jgi:glycosyltransferase involved in cell wall biosynthesis
MGLAEKKVSVVVAVDSGPLDRVRLLESAGVPIRVLSQKPLRPAEYSRAFRELVEHLQPRLIHFNGWEHQCEVVEVASSRDIKMVCTNHSTPRVPLFRERLGIGRIPFNWYRQRAVARRAGPAISISHLAIRNLAARFGRQIHSVVVYNGVPYVDLSETRRCEVEAPRIVWLGSLIKRKRPLLAIEVFKAVLEAHPRAQLVVLGDGPLLPDMRRAGERLPMGTVQIQGFCMSVLDSLKDASLYLQTSADEGLAYSVLDAMSVGLPVVATDAGATSEAVLHEETGLVCRVDDVRQISQALVSILGSPETLARYGQRGLSRVREVFGLERMVSETLAAYTTLCGVRI